MYRVVTGEGGGVAHIVVEGVDDHAVLHDAVTAVWGVGVMRAAGIPSASVEYPLVLSEGTVNGNGLNPFSLVCTSLVAVADGEVRVDELSSSRAALHLESITPRSTTEL